MNKKIFREKSIMKISTPDNLNSYIKIASSATFAVVLAVLIIAVGALVFFTFGKLKGSIDFRIFCIDNEVTAVSDDVSFEEGMKIEIDGTEYTIETIEYDKSNAGEVVLVLDKKLSDGKYEAKIYTTDRDAFSVLFK